MCLLLGYCTEFNVAGGVIQIHYGDPCNKTTVIKSDEVYQSTEAYKCKTISVKLYRNNINWFWMVIISFPLLFVFFSSLLKYTWCASDNCCKIILFPLHLIALSRSVCIFVNNFLKNNFFFVIQKLSCNVSVQCCYELVYSKKKTNISTNTTSTPYIPENK